ncbi:MAG: hypothetical protein ACOCVP_04270, partial [Wenzhouxiangella sp.]
LKAAADNGFIAEEKTLAAGDRIFEYFLNRLRLSETFDGPEFSRLTGLDAALLTPLLDKALDLGLVERAGEAYRVSREGQRCLNDLQSLFLPEE